MNKTFGKVVGAFVLFLSGLSGLSGQVQAGWISGGGNLVKDAQNPWFLENTRQVTYCVWMDEGNFGPSKDLSEEVIQKAIAWWKRQFEAAYYPDPRLGKIASQEFVLINCAPGVQDADIVFQLGTLTAQQQQFMGDPREVVSVAVRTEYDRRNLRGKGFIYVSPERGNFQLNVEGLVDRRWQRGTGGLLLKVLVHELGHVFGLDHGSLPEKLYDAMDFSGLPVVMAAHYPEAVVTAPDSSADEIADGPIGSFFRPRIGFTGTMGHRQFTESLGLTGVSGFIYLSYRQTDRGLEIDLSTETESQTQRLGVISFVGPGTSVEAEYLRVTNIYLPREQEVFSERRIESGPYVVLKRMTGYFYNYSTGAKFPIVAFSGPRTFQFAFLINGKLEFDNTNL